MDRNSIVAMALGQTSENYPLDIKVEICSLICRNCERKIMINFSRLAVTCPTKREPAGGRELERVLSILGKNF